MQEKTTDVIIGEYRYQIGRMTPQVGCWIAMQLMTKMLPAGMDDKVVTGTLPVKRSSELSEDEFMSIQRHALNVVNRYSPVGSNEVPQPIMKGDRFTFQDLNLNIVTVMALTLHSLLFNIAPFFSEDALKTLMGSLKQVERFSDQSSASESTSISIAR